MVGGRRRLFNDHGVDAETVGQQTHREPDRPPADNEHRSSARCICRDANSRTPAVSVSGKTALFWISHKNMFDMVLISF